MGIFITYMENREAQERAVQRALNNLVYAKGFTLGSIAIMPVAQLSSELVGLLPDPSWSMGRFAAMVKSMAGGLR